MRFSYIGDRPGKIEVHSSAKRFRFLREKRSK